MVVLSIILALVCIGLLAYTYKQKKEFQNYKIAQNENYQKIADETVEKYLKDSKDNIEQTLELSYKLKKEELEKDLEQYENNINKTKAAYEESKKTIEDAVKNAETQLEQMKQSEKKVVDEYKDKLEVELKVEIDKEKQKQITQMAAELEKYLNDISSKKDVASEELNKIQEQLKEYRLKRDSLNQEILRQRAIEEEQAFYKVNLTDDEKEDIEILQSFKTRIHNRNAINKLIWDVYVKKGVDQLIKNVLENKEFSGIYKFTHIPTGQIYIGKSTNLKKRVTEHYKSAFDLSQIASSQFHLALKKYGIDEFTYELLEKCDKDKLTEREKYYITHFESDKYGFNQRVG